MLFFASVLSLLLSSAVARTFVDDRGVTHEINGKPTIVTFTRTAVTLAHFGTLTRCVDSVVLSHGLTPNRLTLRPRQGPTRRCLW
jgi:hypothetical protein